MPIRKRKPVELRPSETNSMKRRHPEFGFHKNYIHPWSLFQKRCALQYRQLNNRQRQQLQLQAKTQIPLLIEWTNKFKNKNEALNMPKSQKPTQNPSKFKKGTKLNGYEITMKKIGAGQKKVWSKIKSI